MDRAGALTHALELLFELCLVLAVCDTEVVVRICALLDAVGRSGGSNGHDRGRALSPLSLADFLDGHHFLYLNPACMVWVWRWAS